MSAISVRLADSLHRGVREAAEKDGVSINQFINTAVAEKLSALLAEDVIEARARRASRSKFDQALAKVPDIEPAQEDILEPGRAGHGARPNTRVQRTR